MNRPYIDSQSVHLLSGDVLDDDGLCGRYRLVGTVPTAGTDEKRYIGTSKISKNGRYWYLLAKWSDPIIRKYRFDKRAKLDEIEYKSS